MLALLAFDRRDLVSGPTFLNLNLNRNLSTSEIKITIKKEAAQCYFAAVAGTARFFCTTGITCDHG